MKILPHYSEWWIEKGLHVTGCSRNFANDPSISGLVTSTIYQWETDPIRL